MTYGKKMLAFRKRLGWSQSALARALHSSQSAISRIELGESRRADRAIFALFDMLEASHAEHPDPAASEGTQP